MHWLVCIANTRYNPDIFTVYIQIESRYIYSLYTDTIQIHLQCIYRYNPDTFTVYLQIQPRYIDSVYTDTILIHLQGMFACKLYIHYTGDIQIRS